MTKKIIRNGLNLELIDGIFIFRIVEEISLTMEIVYDITKAMQELSSSARPIMVDFGVHHQPKEVRNYFAKDPNHLSTYTACALFHKKSNIKGVS